jgi:hypothetical protein
MIFWKFGLWNLIVTSVGDRLNRCCITRFHCTFVLPWSLPIDTGVRVAGIMGDDEVFVELRRCFLDTNCGELTGSGDKGPPPLSLSFFRLL